MAVELGLGLRLSVTGKVSQTAGGDGISSTKIHAFRAEVEREGAWRQELPGRRQVTGSLGKSPIVLWDSVLPFGSRDGARSRDHGSSSSRRALDRRPSAHLFTGPGPGTPRAQPERLRKPDTLAVPLTRVVFYDLLEPSE